MKLWHRIVIIFTVAFILTACDSKQVTGDGKSVTETRTLSSFNQITIDGSYRIEIFQGNQEALKITTDSNIEPLIITEVQKENLNIHTKPGININTSQPILIRIVTKQLQSISANGANQIIASGLHGNQLQIDAKGAIQAKLSGTLNKLSLKISGSGKIDAGQLKAKIVKTRLTGSGQIIANATDKLDIKITGSGVVRYRGNPKNIDQSIIGSGKLEAITQN